MKSTLKTNPIHRGGDFSSLPLRSFVACAILLATTAITPAETTLKGKVGPRIINDDVIIARGTTCVLNGTTIKGDVRVLSGAKLYANGAWVDGSVFAYNSLLVDLRESTRVTWNVRAKGTRSILLQDDSQIGGHVRLQNGSAPDGEDVLLVRNSAVVGDVQAGNSTGRMRVLFNTIEGKVKLAENKIGKFAIRNNVVYNDIRFIRNKGIGSIVGNTVGGALVNRGNTPMPIVKRNDVREATLQD